MRRFFALLLSFLFLLSVSLKLTLAQDTLMFTNPILAGFYPDPSICKVDDNYYLVTSTFSYFPGIPVFYSKDLVNWKLITHVMNRPEQMDLKGLGVSRGIFAPAIRYSGGKFYITCTLVDAGGNFVVTSDKPEGPYSDPVFIPEINGIDPSMFFDVEDSNLSPGQPGSVANGKAYIIYNSIAPDDKPLYSGHRTIRMYEFDIENLKVVGEEKILINGGTDLSKNPIWIEGPHIFKVNGYYYLIAAEGGTGDQHSEVVFRSENIFGPYIPYENNPILTQRHLSSERKNPVTSTGHADFVQTDNGDWWAVFLGCRPYSLERDGFYNTGRETFLAPVKWIEDSEGVQWPVINPNYEVENPDSIGEVQYFYPYPLTSHKEIADRPYSGNFKIKDDFESEDLNQDWMFLRTPHEKWYNLSERKSFLSIQLRPETCAGKENPSFLGLRQQHLKGSAKISIDFNPESENEKAGLLIFQNEEHFYFFSKSLDDNKPAVQLYKSLINTIDKNQMELLASEKIPDNQNELFLQIDFDEDAYSFSYSLNDSDWNLLMENVDGKFLSTNVAGGFVGSMFALYATSLGRESNSKAYYNYFEYTGDDKIYSKITQGDNEP